MINNPLKSKLAAGQVVMGSLVTIPSAALTEMMGLAGFDFVVNGSRQFMQEVRP